MVDYVLRALYLEDEDGEAVELNTTPAARCKFRATCTQVPGQANWLEQTRPWPHPRNSTKLGSCGPPKRRTESICDKTLQDTTRYYKTLHTDVFEISSPRKYGSLCVTVLQGIGRRLGRNFYSSVLRENEAGFGKVSKRGPDKMPALWLLKLWSVLS
ncbi:hypothetical protein EDB80DRAFT_731043 [Ilyonectria destructans]|nr:hypothetical protein EDB80DRAFT_734579 [Ilyonectria destructans]KAH6988762.1 hypothetical protein EDB80DRAFT_731043 [Ilyonectria destructans]